MALNCVDPSALESLEGSELRRTLWSASSKSSRSTLPMRIVNKSANGRLLSVTLNLNLINIPSMRLINWRLLITRTPPITRNGITGRTGAYRAESESWILAKSILAFSNFSRPAF